MMGDVVCPIRQKMFFTIFPPRVLTALPLLGDPRLAPRRILLVLFAKGVLLSTLLSVSSTTLNVSAALLSTLLSSPTMRIAFPSPHSRSSGAPGNNANRRSASRWLQHKLAGGRLVVQIVVHPVQLNESRSPPRSS